MNYWKNKAATLPPGLDGHHWVPGFRAAMEAVQPALVATLSQYPGELDAYVRCQIAEAIAEFERNLASGSEMAVAEELARDLLMPKEPDDAEEWEREGAEEDAIAGLDDFLDLTQ